MTTPTPPRRQRRATDPGEFEDPLKNYNAPEYADELEASLAEHALSDLRSTPVTTVDPDTTVAAAIKTMADLDVGSVLIVENDRLIGILSQRDVLRRIARKYDDVKDKPISEFMTRKPVKVYDTEPAAKALHMMAVHRVRHIPIVDVDEKVVGVLGPRRVTEYLQQHFKPEG